MKRMLINATQEEELRMAMVDGQRLYDLNIEGSASERKKANIYKGKITRIEPSLEAAFIDYGADRHGFLPFKEISSEYYVKQPQGGGKPSIKEVLREGQDIVVQIDKEERGNKGAALTTYVSLAGRFIVLKPNKDRSGGVSRRITGGDRDAARQSLNEIEIPDGMSVILRTAGIDRTAEELAWDLENLLSVWRAILNVVTQRPSPFLIYRESNSVIRALRDYLTNEIGEILIDDEATYNEALEFVEQVMPHNARKLKYYDDAVPLFTRFQIESQIESAFAHQVTLPSGGSIVIDHTEALVSIDINSARATKGGDIEATALNTNLEAAEEIARQLRIRDLGGLIVIDFIDMGPQKNQREVENRLRESVRQDRARVQIGKISRFGLLEMSRQRLRPSIGESAYQTCPRCSGFGTIRSIESLALAILRLIGEEARKERTAKVIAQLPVEVATYLLNEKRDWVQSLESSNDTQVILVANSNLETPHYDVRRVRDDQADLPENAGVSYALAEDEAELEIPSSMEDRKVVEQAAVEVIKPTTPAPQRPEPEQPKTGFFSWLGGLFSSDDDTGEGKRKKKSKKKKPAKRRGSQTSGRGRGRGGDSQRGGEQRKKSGKKRPARKKAKGPKPKQAQQDEKQGQGKGGGPQGGEKADDGQAQKRPPRSRRSRGGRRRRRGGERADENQQNAQQNQGSENKADDKSAPTGEKQESKVKDRPADQQSSAPEQAADGGKKKKKRSKKKKKQHASDSKKDRSPKQDTTGDSPKQEAAPKDDRKPDASEKRPDKPEAKTEPTPKPQPDAKGDDKPSQPAAGGETPKKQDAKRKPSKASSEKPARDKPSGDDTGRKADAKPDQVPKEKHREPEKKSKPDKPSDEKPKSDGNKPSRSGNGAAQSDDDKPSGSEKKSPAADKKPEGRLLPWEPATPAADSPPKAERKEGKDKKPEGAPDSAD